MNKQLYTKNWKLQQRTQPAEENPTQQEVYHQVTNINPPNLPYPFQNAVKASITKTNRYKKKANKNTKPLTA